MEYDCEDMCTNGNSWGPVGTVAKLENLPYQPYSKQELIGRVGDWSSLNYYDKKNNEKYNSQYQSLVNNMLDTRDDKDFTLVDSKVKTKKSRLNVNRQRHVNNTQTRQVNNGKMSNWFKERQRQIRKKQKLYSKNVDTRNNGIINYRLRKPSIEIRESWEVSEEIDLSRLTKVVIQIPELKTLLFCGQVNYNNTNTDKITSAQAIPLKDMKGKSVNISATDDCVMRNFARNREAKIFTTDHVLSRLMSCIRSVYSWDIIVHKVKDMIFFDSRDKAHLDYLHVGETAINKKVDETDLNSPAKISDEATNVYYNFKKQVLSNKQSPEFTWDSELEEKFQDRDYPFAGFKYQKFNLGEYSILVRCEVDAVTKGENGDKYMKIFSLTEWGRLLTNQRWKNTLDQQRATVLAEEVKNNNFVVARWAISSILAGVDHMKIGFVARNNPDSNTDHTILHTRIFTPTEFCTQINCNIGNAFAIFKDIIDRVMEMDDGRYICMKDPTKRILRFYTIAADEFDSENEDEIHSIKFVNGNVYQGQMKDGLLDGFGKIYIASKKIEYTGSFKKNTICGRGKFIWKDKSTYEGDVQNGLRHGYGTFTSSCKELKYTGFWSHGKRHGKGRLDYDSTGNCFYDGDWYNNKRHGWGLRQWKTENLYEGGWVDNVREGEGTMRWITKKNIYICNWKDGKPNGSGEYIYFIDRKRDSVQFYLPNVYSGNFKDGKRDGSGIFYYSNGSRFEGNWINNKKEGEGRMMFRNGFLKMISFKNDVMITDDVYINGFNKCDCSRSDCICDNCSIYEYGPDFVLNIEFLFENITNHEALEEQRQLIYSLVRYSAKFRDAYSTYARLLNEQNPDNSALLSRICFWRMLLDLNIVNEENTLRAYEKILQLSVLSNEDAFQPNGKLLFKQFIIQLTILSYHLYGFELQNNVNSKYILSGCISKLVSEHFTKINIGGSIFTNKDMVYVLNTNGTELYNLLVQYCRIFHKTNFCQMSLRNFIHMLNDFEYIDKQYLTIDKILNVICNYLPGVNIDDCINLEKYVLFLDLFEILALISQHISINKLTKNYYQTKSPKCISSISIDKMAEVEDRTETESPDNEMLEETEMIKKSDQDLTELEDNKQSLTQGTETQDVTECDLDSSQSPETIETESIRMKTTSAETILTGITKFEDKCVYKFNYFLTKLLIPRLQSIVASFKEFDNFLKTPSNVSSRKESPCHTTLSKVME
ncbi:hypothetical protein A3Q56_00083 [Intoshia linei]|uniref:Uncharacterized protein n=1 Tax=Intoshia linei TaxID=1819745 RepID=A0A177BEZ3_9BILA|nr:hypothetical protein A3Q56_00083 [Intoshia linei]